MASIAENLRATLLSLKQISDRVKSLVTTSVTKSEATADKNAILSAIGNIPAPDLSSVSKESQTKDGNDTAISVAKDVRSELGTGSDTAAETGTLFAVLKWTKNKVKDIYNAITDSTNGLSAIKTSAASAATDAAAAKTATQSLTALDGDIVAGKAALATQINAKSPLVPVTGNSALTDMATAVASISQETIEIDGGEMYAAQQTGNGALWDLYQVLAQMKNTFINATYLHNGNSYRYAALLVCEYYKGYDSLQLKGADAYYTCDGDFYPTSQPLHTWHDDDNGKANRWIAFLYATEGATFEVGVNDTAISPSSIYVGGHIGTIAYNTNGRLTELVCGVEETDVVDNFNGLTYSQSFAYKAILRNAFIKNGSTLNNGGFVFVDTKVQNLQTNYESILTTDAQYCELSLKENFIFTNNTTIVLIVTTNNQIIKINGQIHGDGRVILLKGYNTNSTTNIVDIRGYTGGGSIFAGEGGGAFFAGIIDLIVGAATRSFNTTNWRPNYLSDIDKKAKLIDNIKNHILARVSDATGGTQLVFTVHINMYNAIASETITWNDQTMTLADAFLTKNWLLAGA